MSTCPPAERIEIDVRVRYDECDPMNVAHHSVYLIWLEMARTELLRQLGQAYRDLEAQGVYFVVARVNVRYRRPARYDDVLRVSAQTVRATSVKIDHEYEVHRGHELLAQGQSTLVCVDGNGRPRRIPDCALP